MILNFVVWSCDGNSHNNYLVRCVNRTMRFIASPHRDGPKSAGHPTVKPGPTQTDYLHTNRLASLVTKRPGNVCQYFT